MPVWPLRTGMLATGWIDVVSVYQEAMRPFQQSARKSDDNLCMGVYRFAFLQSPKWSWRKKSHLASAAFLAGAWEAQGCPARGYPCLISTALSWSTPASPPEWTDQKARKEGPAWTPIDTLAGDRKSWIPFLTVCSSTRTTHTVTCPP